MAPPLLGFAGRQVIVGVHPGQSVHPHAKALLGLSLHGGESRERFLQDSAQTAAGHTQVELAPSTR